MGINYYYNIYIKLTSSRSNSGEILYCNNLTCVLLGKWEFRIESHQSRAKSLTIQLVTAAGFWILYFPQKSLPWLQYEPFYFLKKLPVSFFPCVFIQATYLYIKTKNISYTLLTIGWRTVTLWLYHIITGSLSTNFCEWGIEFNTYSGKTFLLRRTIFIIRPAVPPNII